MRVERVQSTTPPVQVEKVEVSEKDQGQKTQDPAALYEKSRETDKQHVYNKDAVMQLKRQSQDAHAQLRRIVESLLRRQGMSFQQVLGGENIEVDEQARLEAQELISEDGILGIEAVSNRIVDFAKAISGEDKSKLESLRKSIDKGFKEAERILGGLPEISQKTYDRIMEKLDAWENEE